MEKKFFIVLVLASSERPQIYSCNSEHLRACSSSKERTITSAANKTAEKSPIVVFCFLNSRCRGRADKRTELKLVLLFSRVWVRTPVVTLVSPSKTLNYNCFSSLRGKWVHVRAEMVLVIDLAE